MPLFFESGVIDPGSKVDLSGRPNERLAVNDLTRGSLDQARAEKVRADPAWWESLSELHVELGIWGTPVLVEEVKAQALIPVELHVQGDRRHHRPDVVGELVRK